MTVSQRRFATEVQPFLQAAAAASPPQSWGAASPSWGVASAQSPSPTSNSPSWSANPPSPVQGDSHISPVSKSVMKLRKSSHPGATDVIEPAMTFAQAGGVQTAFQSRGLPTAAASLVKERELCPAMTCWHMWGTLLPSVIWSYDRRGEGCTNNLWSHLLFCQEARPIPRTKARVCACCHKKAQHPSNGQRLDLDHSAHARLSV